MLIQKTFHLWMARQTAKEKLSDLGEYNRFLAGVEEARLDPEGLAHFRCRLPGGFRARLDVAEIPGKNPAQTLFESHEGNMVVTGVVEYFQIKPNLTEVVLTLDYRFRSPIYKAIDYAFSNVDRFLNRQLQLIEAHFNQTPAGFRADRSLRQPINGHRLREEPL